jgi:hypothetical protein
MVERAKDDRAAGVTQVSTAHHARQTLDPEQLSKGA